ncbi:centriolar coiled-coil protein of 110 kDa-like [Thalassophryne amazonica]|uniref:centriolar coiled-coil protein of 110 kDa-like n=1 Tax=Thalassophryne amazonica TaxID=390379 RepID=UPI001470A2A0|nr:centriolar coiled-coil protein of 110 kDa-like [Thalassophryne amazonica]
MCGCTEMESYEAFCLRSVAVLQEEGMFKKTCEALSSPKACSVICFHGRAVLSPLLNAEQRTEMFDLRRHAVQLEVNRQDQQRIRVLAGVQNILDQTQTGPCEEVNKQPTPLSCLSSKCETVGGYTLVTDSPGLPTNPECSLKRSDQPAITCSETLSINDDRAVEMEEESGDAKREDFNVGGLLKRSREFVKREQSQQGSTPIVSVIQTPSPDITQDKENTHRSQEDTSIEFGFSLHHSPIGLPQTQPQHQELYDPKPHQAACLSPSLPECYTHLHSLEPTVNTRAHKRRPRPVSAGNIHISFPIEPEDLIPQSPGRSGKSAGIGSWGDVLSAATSSSDCCGSVGGEGGCGFRRGNNRHSSHCITSPVQEVCSPVAHHDHLASGFRRRCHTMDSQLHTSFSYGGECIDRSQERAPRFMAGVTCLAPSRRSPSSLLNQTYEVENPSACLLKHRAVPELSEVKLRVKLEDPQEPNTGEKQRRAKAVEDMQKHVEEEHALQMSLLWSEKKKQQCLCVEVEEAGRRLKEQPCDWALSGHACRWNWRSVSDNCAVMSPSCPGISPAHTPSEPSPGHGLHIPVSSSMASPCVQSPVYLWGPTWGTSKTRSRLSLILTPEQQRAFCRICAIARGFLTRRLLKTEKVKQLRQTVVDIRSSSAHSRMKLCRKKVSCLHKTSHCKRRVRAQLRVALYDIHDIFF